MKNFLSCSFTFYLFLYSFIHSVGVRRILFRNLWDETTNNVSYQRLVNTILEITKNAEDVQSISYKDVDGDIIKVSLDNELADAFEQYVNEVPPVLRATANWKVAAAAVWEKMKNHERKQEVDLSIVEKKQDAVGTVSARDDDGDDDDVKDDKMDAACTEKSDVTEY